MIDEPYRWLEAIGNRREYVREQIKTGSPVFAASLPDGILLAGIGSGNSKVFEVFDRHALGGLGHPADIEKIRQGAIDAAHTEAFTRAPEDVSLRRLVSYGLSPQLKTTFEQIFSAPFLVELLLVELGRQVEEDVLLRLHFDGAFEFQGKGLAVAAGRPEQESAALNWLQKEASGKTGRKEILDLFLQAWWCMTEEKSFTEETPSEEERRQGWRTAVEGKVVEIGWLARTTERLARFERLSLNDEGL